MCNERLPSYEGSGLKCLDVRPTDVHTGLPSCEGSGLKYVRLGQVFDMLWSPLV